MAHAARAPQVLILGFLIMPNYLVAIVTLLYNVALLSLGMEKLDSDKCFN